MNDVGMVVAPQRAVQVGGAGLPTKDEFETITGLAGWVARGRMFPQYQSAEQVFTALLYIRDLGLAMLPGLAKGHFINGKFNVEVDAKLAAVQGRLPDFEWNIIEQSEARCIVRGRVGKASEWKESSFTAEDAKRAGLMGRDTYKNYLRDMLLWRALGRLLKIVAGPALYGMPLAISQDLDEPEDSGSEAVVEDVPRTALDALESRAVVGPDYKALFIARATACGYRGADGLKRLVNLLFKERGLTEVRGANEVASADWKMLFEEMDRRYDEKGAKRFSEQANGEVAVETPPASAAPADVTSSPVAAAEPLPLEFPPVAEAPPAEPVDEALALVSACEAGDADAIMRLGLWAAEHLGGKWLAEHPEGSKRIFVVHGVTLREAGQVQIQEGREVAVPVLIAKAANDEQARIHNRESLASVGKAMVSAVAELRRTARADVAGRVMPAKASEALRAARGSR